MTDLYLAWQDPKDRSWFPVGKLSFDGSVYRFVYISGVKKIPSFVPFGPMNDLSAIYESHQLFPLFANRLLSNKRPEYKDLLRWLNIAVEEDDALTVLARTGGIRETDCFAVFPCPERKTDNTYQVQFLVHGIRYLPKEAIERIRSLSPRERLYLMPDPQNEYDASAIMLRTEKPGALVGYCPRYFARDFLVLLQRNEPDKVRVVVERVNSDAPLQFRLLCCLTAPWLEGFRPCSDERYEPLAEAETFNLPPRDLLELRP